MIKSIFFFGFAGVVGFIVDAGVLMLLKDFLGLYLARALSFFLAVVSTWIINRNLAFSGKTSEYSVVKEFCVYLGAMLVGGTVNYTVYAVLVGGFIFFEMNPVIAIAVGSIIGMGVNWLSSNFFIFRKTHEQ